MHLASCHDVIVPAMGMGMLSACVMFGREGEGHGLVLCW